MEYEIVQEGSLDDFINTVAGEMDRARSTACPYCGVRCVKTYLCNHMVCPKCEGNFCYLCGAGLGKGNEGCNSNHFSTHNGVVSSTGSPEEQERIDNERVRVAGQRKADEWRRNHPGHEDYKLPSFFGIN